MLKKVSKYLILLRLFYVFQSSHSVHVEYSVEIDSILTPESFTSQNLAEYTNHTLSSNQEWPVYIKLNNGHIYGCDFIVSATGVEPNTKCFSNTMEVFQI